MEHGLGKDPETGRGAGGGGPPRIGGIGGAGRIGGRTGTVGAGAGADLVLVPEPHHRRAAGPHAVVPGALEGAPHRQLERERGAALAARHVREVLAPVHAQVPAHDPVRVQGPSGEPRRRTPGLDDVALTGEEPSQPLEEFHGGFPNRDRPEWARGTGSPSARAPIRRAGSGGCR